MTALNWELRECLAELRPDGRLNLLTALILHANIRLRCWPGIDTLCKETGCGQHTVTEAKKWLGEHGAIRLVPFDKRMDDELYVKPDQHVYQLTGIIRLDDGTTRPYLYMGPEAWAEVVTLVRKLPAQSERTTGRLDSVADVATHTVADGATATVADGATKEDTVKEVPIKNLPPTQKRVGAIPANPEIFAPTPTLEQSDETRLKPHIYTVPEGLTLSKERDYTEPCQERCGGVLGIFVNECPQCGCPALWRGGRLRQKAEKKKAADQKAKISSPKCLSEVTEYVLTKAREADPYARYRKFKDIDDEARLNALAKSKGEHVIREIVDAEMLEGHSGAGLIRVVINKASHKQSNLGFNAPGYYDQ